MPKYLFTFQKTETVRYLGHLDILRTFERAIRRAALPIAFSAGFNPRERIAFASALSTGVTGAAEPAIIELTEPVPTDQIERRLNEALPPAIRVGDCEEIADSGSRDLLNAYVRAEYDALCECPPDTESGRIAAAICELLAQPALPIVREREGRSKPIDLRPLLFHLALSPERPDPNRVNLRMIVAIGESGNARPAEIVAALGELIPGISLRRAHRVRLLTAGA
ncbi:MAG TPA: TIGR03936 family radical SAM-associated protein [Chthonomonadaceae bacterium]|nr:TIGR03936 family radical SAM-associated protein [Chthonomonadaceae bacterium]